MVRGNKPSNMTTDDMKFQGETLEKYRGDIIPTMEKIRLETGVSTTTIAKFLNGTSANAEIRIYLRLRFKKNFKALPPDILKLFAIWDKDK